AHRLGVWICRVQPWDVADRCRVSLTQTMDLPSDPRSITWPVDKRVIGSAGENVAEADRTAPTPFVPGSTPPPTEGIPDQNQADQVERRGEPTGQTLAVDGVALMTQEHDAPRAAVGRHGLWPPSSAPRTGWQHAARNIVPQPAGARPHPWPGAVR